MLPKASVLFCVLVLVTSQITGRRRGYYTVVAPGTVRTNTPYKVSVSLSDFDKSFRCNISLGNDQFKVQRSVVVQPKTMKLVSMDIPKLNFGTATLTVNGVDGIIAANELRVSIQPYNYQVYMQTDKPWYKPGELVKFRVICIDEKTRPAIPDDILDVLIHDSDENLVKRIENIKLTQGVFKGQLQLSDYTSLGRWTIKVESSGYGMREKTFIVSRYVLSRFTMEIVTKSDVSVHEEKINVLVKAMYAYDKPVKGNLKVDFSLESLELDIPNLNFSRQALIDGNHMITLDFENDLNIRQDKFNSLYLHLKARFTDAESEQVIEKEATITLHDCPYKIRVKAPKVLIPEVPVYIEVSITDWQGIPVTDQRNPVNITLTGQDDYVYGPSIIYLNKQGVGVAQLNLNDTDTSSYTLSVKFNGYEQDEQFHIGTGNGFSLTVLTPRPNIGEEMVIQLRSQDPIDHFVYEIVSAGKILMAERVNVTNSSKTHLLRILTTHAMIPKISLYVHRIKEGEMKSTLTDIYIDKALQNSIGINVDREVRPGAVVSVDVSTDEGSYVGLMGIDKQLLLETDQENDFTCFRDLSGLREYNSLSIKKGVDAGSAAGLMTITNLVDSDPSIGSRFGDDGDSTKETSKIRQIFSDGWLFEDFERTPKGGFQLHSTIPDSITSWEIFGFSLHPITGLSFTKSSLKSFQSFLVSMDLPNMIREGEILDIPVYVFNHNDAQATTTLTIESQSEHLVIPASYYEDALFSFNQTLSVQIPSNGIIKFTFLVRPLKAGLFNLTVAATSNVGSDTLQKSLLVVSQGITHVASKSYLVHFLEHGEQQEELVVSIPESAIRGSEKVEMLVVGDAFGPLMQTFWDLVQVPYGNGREITTQFISNLLVLKYMKVFNVTNPSLERKALVFLEMGYQSLLPLRHLDGSFSFFERSMKRTGDALETALVAWGLQQAKHFIHIDHKIIARCLNSYLKPMQAPDGGIQTESATGDIATLTALALLSFMEDESHAEVTSKGLDFLHNHLNDQVSPISAALSKYVLVLGKHKKSAQILKQLSDGHTGKQFEWDTLTTLQGALKATSSSFLRILQSQAKPTETLLPLVTALLSSGESEKIPTHLLALDAMIEIARNLRVGARNLSLHFEGDEGDSGDVNVNSGNAHVLRTVQLNSKTRKVRLYSSGEGFAVVTIKTHYNMPRENQTSSTFQTSVALSERKNSRVSLEVCVSARTATNFAAVKVNLPSGYTFLEENDNFDLETVVAHKFDSGAGRMEAIIKDVDQMGTCIRLDALRTFRVLNAKEATVTVSDVYNDDQTFISFHEMDMDDAKES